MDTRVDWKEVLIATDRPWVFGVDSPYGIS